MIKKLSLKNFRRFKDIELSFNSRTIIIYGNNAQGKSSILEAIYLMSNNKSPWSGSDEYIHNHQNEITEHSRIEMEVDEKTYIYYKDNNRKIYMIDGRKTNSKKFYSQNISTIFNPEKIDLLMLSPSHRRDFLDETISNINYEYSFILKRYRRLIRQRNSYLKKLSKQFYEKGVIARNNPQLNIWTKQLIELSAQIYKERINIIKKFEQENFKLQYQFCDKELEKILQAKENIKLIEDLLQKSIENSKKRDIVTGYTNIGPHRDDWNIFTNQDIKKYGSRGQKRIAISNLVFKAHDITAQEIGYYPTLLLDDIASELDNENIKEIFEKDILQKQQTFITTVNPKILPLHIKKDAQMINLNEF